MQEKSGMLRQYFFTAFLIAAHSLAAFALAEEPRRIDNIPMYGQPEIARPDTLKKADEEFVQQAISAFGSREGASRAWYAQAEGFMAKRDFDLAMRRYNQSWLLNPNNYQPYWGFGRVMMEQGKVSDAIRHLEKSKELVDDPYQRVALLADLGTAYSLLAQQSAAGSVERSRWFELANQRYADALSVDPSYGNAWRRWAMSLYEEGNYAAAWDKVKKAKAQNARPLPPSFIRALEQRLPEPGKTQPVPPTD